MRNITKGSIILSPTLIVFHEQAECQNMFSHLVEIDDKSESDWLASTFLNPGIGSVFHLFLLTKRTISKQIQFIPRAINWISVLERRMFINTCQISCPKYIQGETNLLLNLHMSKRAQLYTKPQKAFKHFDNIEDQIVFSWQRSYEAISFTNTIIVLNSENLIIKLYIIVSV